MIADHLSRLEMNAGKEKRNEIAKNFPNEQLFLLLVQTPYVKPEKNLIFLKNGKTVISVENRKFSRSRMTKRIAPLNSSYEI